MSERSKVELLAPAGNPQAFYGALNAGADAVYLAGNQYGARAYADNFSEEELLACLRYAHLFQKKIYLTVNTLMKQDELNALPAFLEPFVSEGLDGVIVQDFGALLKIHECFPALPLHASTQMNITGSNGAKALKLFGVERIVPARELSLDEIRHLVRESGMEVECFIHGAICYCYSGQCLFSSLLGGRSGNRGRCAQPCRLPYQIPDTQPGQENSRKTETANTRRVKSPDQYPLSLKDMCTLTILPELIEAGISSFKIEGRMKKAEYAAGVTALYRKYIDLYYAGKWQAPSKKDLSSLESLYIRSEIGTGYYHCHNGKNMITLSSPSYRGSDEKQLEKIREDYLTEKNKIPLLMHGVFRLGQNAQVWVKRKNDKDWIIVCGDSVEKASKSPVTEDNLRKQLAKIGDTSFVFESANITESLTLDTEDGIFCSLKAVNELRRRAISALEEVILHEK